MRFGSLLPFKLNGKIINYFLDVFGIKQHNFRRHLSSPLVTSIKTVYGIAMGAIINNNHKRVASTTYVFSVKVVLM